MLLLSEKIYGNEEIDAMINVLKSDKLTMGTLVKTFELEFAKKFNFNYCVMVNSGSSANLLALSVLSNIKRKKHLKKNDRVLVPAVCWSTSVYPIVQCGLIPVFMDSSDKTMNIIPEDIEKYDNISGIVLVHILGNCTNMDKVMEIVKKKDLIVLEDTCESLSCSYKSQYLGSFGHMGTFSFYYSHHITTIEGGMITCKTEEDYNLLKCLRAHGWSRDCNIDTNIENIDNNQFYFINLGFNLRPMEIQAAMGLEQLKKIDIKNENRKYNYDKFTQKLINDERNLDIFKIFITTEYCDSYPFAIPILLTNTYKKDRKNFMEYLSKNNIENRPIVTGNFTRQPVIQLINKNINPDLFKGADKIHFNGFYIGCPTFKKLSTTEITDIIDIFYNFPNFNKIIPFFDKPYCIEKSIPYINDAIISTWISSGGKYINKCEDLLKEITNNKYIILTNTGTSAIHCMIKCLKYKFPNCKKIYIPNNTYIACINMLLQEYPIEYLECLDVNSDTLVLDIDTIINIEKNAALFIIHNISGITNIIEIKNKRPDLIIFEDNAEGFLGFYNNQATGSLSIASSLSFNMNKNFTCGMGGAFCTNDIELYNYILSYTKHGITNNKFDYKLCGNNYRLTNIAASILLSQIEMKDEILSYKKNLYNLYIKYLNNIKGITIQKFNNNTIPSYWSLVIKMEKNINYNFIENQLLKYNIEIRPMFKPLHKFSYLNNLIHNKHTNSNYISDKYFFLPFNNITEKHIIYICNSLKKITEYLYNNDLKIINVKKQYNSIEYIKEFIENTELSDKFTYFNKRDYNVINNHLYTILLQINNNNIGYGHIDFENDIYWLGICIYKSYQKKKYGSFIIHHLLEYAKNNNINNIQLIIKNDNLDILPFYQYIGFKKIFTTNTNDIIMKFNL